MDNLDLMEEMDVMECQVLENIKILDYMVFLALLVHKSGGAVYVRWGRTACPTGRELVYSG